MANRLNWTRLFELLLETPGDGAGGGGAAGSAAGANGGGSTAGNTGTAGSASGGSAASGDTTRTGAAASGTPFTYTEDRSRWIPPHRLNEETTKRQTLEGQLHELQTKYTENTKRLQALAGVSTPDPREQKSAGVKEAFFQMFPQFRRLAELNDDQLGALLETPAHVQAAQSAESRHWARHGDQMVGQIAEQIAEAYGADKLTPRQIGMLKTNFREWLTETVQGELSAGNGHSATLEAYEKGDPKAVENFVKQYQEDWVAPAQRRATSQTLTRTRPVPDSRGRTQMTTIERPAKFNSLDERLDYAAKLAKERGVQFGR